MGLTPHAATCRRAFRQSIPFDWLWLAAATVGLAATLLGCGSGPSDDTKVASSRPTAEHAPPPPPSATGPAPSPTNQPNLVHSVRSMKIKPPKETPAAAPPSQKPGPAPVAPKKPSTVRPTRPMPPIGGRRLPAGSPTSQPAQAKKKPAPKKTPAAAPPSQKPGRAKKPPKRAKTTGYDPRVDGKQRGTRGMTDEEWMTGGSTTIEMFKSCRSVKEALVYVKAEAARRDRKVQDFKMIGVVGGILCDWRFDDREEIHITVHGRAPAGEVEELVQSSLGVSSNQVDVVWP